MYVFMHVCTHVHAGTFLINSSVTDVHFYTFARDQNSGPHLYCMHFSKQAIFPASLFYLHMTKNEHI